MSFGCSRPQAVAFKRFLPPSFVSVTVCSAIGITAKIHAMEVREFLDIDPRLLHLPYSRLSGADPVKLRDQMVRFA
jgi:hypothetical protein